MPSSRDIRGVVLAACAALQAACQAPGPRAPYLSEPAVTTVDDTVAATACGEPLPGPALPEARVESDAEYLARLDAMDVEALPVTYDLSAVSSFDSSLLEYMLDRRDVSVLDREELLAAGVMGRAALLALGAEPAPSSLDLHELRRGLFHFYACERGLPPNLEAVRARFGDYRQWPSFEVANSFPKRNPRRVHYDAEVGVYVAETIRDGQVSETEILIAGAREDGALDFAAYLPDGQLTNRGHFRAGADTTVGAAPYTCMTCHVDSESDEYDVLFPALALPEDTE